MFAESAHTVVKHMRTYPIVIAGGGVAGLNTAIALDHLIGEDLTAPIYLVDAQPVHVPVSSSDLYSSRGVRTRDYNQVLKGTRVHFIQSPIMSIDLANQAVVTAGHRLPYVDLVLALGRVPKFQPRDDYDWHTHGYDTKQLDGIRRRVADIVTSPERRKPIVVIGGGVTGVELTAHLADLIDSQSVGQVRPKPYLVLFEAADRLAPNLPVRASQRLHRYLHERGVEVYTGTPVQLIDGVIVFDDRTLAPHLAIWTNGHAAHPVTLTPGLRHAADGRVIVNSSLQAIDHDGVWVVGDAAAVEDAGTIASARAHARHIARNIYQRRRGDIPQAYYPEKHSVTIHLGPQHGVLVRGRHVSEGPHAAWLKKWQARQYDTTLMPRRFTFGRSGSGEKE